MQVSAQHQAYWNKTLRMTAILLAIWFVFTFVIGFFAIPLSGIVIFGWPLSFYMGAQGSLIVYLLVIWYYQHYMNRLDEEYGVAEGEDA